MCKPVEKEVEVAGTTAEVFGAELRDSEREEIWDDGRRLRNWTLELLRLRDAKIKEQQQAGSQQLKIFADAATRFQAAEKSRLRALGIDIEPLIPKIVFIHRQRGKPQGSQFAEAYADAKFIKKEWQRVFHRERRKDPTAYDVAADYHGVGVDQLLNYGRNRNRTSRRKPVR